MISAKNLTKNRRFSVEAQGCKSRWGCVPKSLGLTKCQNLYPYLYLSLYFCQKYYFVSSLRVRGVTLSTSKVFFLTFFFNFFWKLTKNLDFSNFFGAFWAWNRDWSECARPGPRAPSTGIGVKKNEGVKNEKKNEIIKKHQNCTTKLSLDTFFFTPPLLLQQSNYEWPLTDQK